MANKKPKTNDTEKKVIVVEKEKVKAPAFVMVKLTDKAPMKTLFIGGVRVTNKKFNRVRNLEKIIKEYTDKGFIEVLEIGKEEY